MNWMEYLKEAESVLNGIAHPGPTLRGLLTGPVDLEPRAQQPTPKEKYASTLARYSKQIREFVELRDAMSEEDLNFLYRDALPDVMAKVGQLVLHAQYNQGRNAIVLGGLDKYSPSLMSQELAELESLRRKLESMRKTNSENARKPRRDYQKIRDEYAKFELKYNTTRGALSTLKGHFGWDPRTIKKALNEANGD